MNVGIGLAAATAFLVCAVVTGGVQRFGVRLGLVDVPNQRSSHRLPVPRGGGLGIVAGVLGGLAVSHLLGALPSVPLPVIVAGAGCMAAIGLADDLFSLPALPRLLAGLLVALLTALSAGGWTILQAGALAVPLGLGGAVLMAVWVTGATNFFNFMDGIDGLAAGQTGAVGVGLLVAAWSPAAATLGALLLGAGAGFLLWNRPPARVFMGDVGSLFLGFLVAAAPLLAAPQDRARALVATAIALALFLLDPLDTLLRRGRRGLRIGEAHRDHAYQRLSPAGSDPTRVTVTLVGAGLLLALLAAFAYHHPPVLPLAALAGALIYLVERRQAFGRSA